MHYIVIEGSKSGHCCFDFTVVDTTKKNESVCECFDREDAELIAEALNKTRTKLWICGLCEEITESNGPTKPGSCTHCGHDYLVEEME